MNPAHPNAFIHPGLVYQQMHAHFPQGVGARTGPHKLKAHSTLFMSNPKDLEDTDKVILPPSILHSLMGIYQNNMPHPLIFEIKNTKFSVISHCGVLEFSSEDPSVAYLPQWMMENLLLEDGAEIEVRPKKLPKLNFVQFKPLTHKFGKLPDPKSTLEHCLHKFTTLTKGDQIKIVHHGESYTLNVTDIKPCEGDKPAGCVVDTNLTVDFAVPVEEKGEEQHAEKIPFPCEIEGVVGANCYMYYKFKIRDKHMGIKVSLNPVVGDPDLYISTKLEKPETSHYDWAANSSKTKEIHIYPSDPNFSSNWYYVAVHAFKNSAQFKLEISEEEPDASEEAKTVDKTRIYGEVGQPDDPTKSKCDNCWRFIPKASSGMHSLQCPRMNWRCQECNEIVKKSEKASHIHCVKCGLVMDATDLEKHMALVHVAKECACGAKVAPDLFQVHKTDSCPLRPVKCKFCDVQCPFRERDRHENYCGSKSILCERCSQPVPRKSMQIHLAAFHHVNPCLDNAGNRRRHGNAPMDPDVETYGFNPTPHREADRSGAEASSSDLPPEYAAMAQQQDQVAQLMKQTAQEHADREEKQMQEALQESMKVGFSPAVSAMSADFAFSESSSSNSSASSFAPNASSSSSSFALTAPSSSFALTAPSSSSSVALDASSSSSFALDASSSSSFAPNASNSNSFVHASPSSSNRNPPGMPPISLPEAFSSASSSASQSSFRGAQHMHSNLHSGVGDVGRRQLSYSDYGDSDAALAQAMAASQRLFEQEQMKIVDECENAQAQPSADASDKQDEDMNSVGDDDDDEDYGPADEDMEEVETLSCPSCGQQFLSTEIAAHCAICLDVE